MRYRDGYVGHIVWNSLSLNGALALSEFPATIRY